LQFGFETRIGRSGHGTVVQSLGLRIDAPVFQGAQDVHLVLDYVERRPPTRVADGHLRAKLVHERSHAAHVARENAQFRRVDSVVKERATCPVRDV
jgi:hypothetical protein